MKCGFAAVIWAGLCFSLLAADSDETKATFRSGQRIELQVGGSFKPAVVIRHEEGTRYRVRMLDPKDKPQERYALEPFMRAPGVASKPDSDAAADAPTTAPQPIAGDAVDREDADLGVIRGARKVELGTVSKTWRIAAAERPAVPDAAHPSQTLALTGRTGDFFEKVQGPWVTADGSKALIAFADGRPAQDKRLLRVETCDLAAGRSLGVAVIPTAGDVADISPNGRFIAITYGAWARGMDGQVVIVSVEDPAKPLAVTRLRVPSATWPDRAGCIEWVRFTDDEHVLTFGDRQLALWRVGDRNAVYVAELGLTITPSLDHDRRYVTWGHDSQVMALDAMTGGVKGAIDGVPASFATVRLSPDASRVAINRGGSLTVLDAATGQLQHEISYPPGGGDECWWIDPHFVLTGSGHVLDVDSGMVAWRLVSGTHPTFSGAKALASGTLIILPEAVGRNHAGSLQVVPLPMDEVRRAQQNLTPEEVFAVRPGVSISIAVNIADDPAAEARIAESITQRLAAQGIPVAEGQPVTLVASWRREPAKSQEYTFGHGPFAQTTTATVAEQHMRLAFEQDGKPLWSRIGVVGSPGFIQLKEGQSLQQALDDMTRTQYTLLEQCPLPLRVPHARYANGFGTTTLAP